MTHFGATASFPPPSRSGARRQQSRGLAHSGAVRFQEQLEAARIAELRSVPATAFAGMTVGRLDNQAATVYMLVISLRSGTHVSSDLGTLDRAGAAAHRYASAAPAAKPPDRRLPIDPRSGAGRRSTWNRVARPEASRSLPASARFNRNSRQSTRTPPKKGDQAKPTSPLVSVKPYEKTPKPNPREAKKANSGSLLTFVESASWQNRGFGIQNRSDRAAGQPKSDYSFMFWELRSGLKGA